MLWPFPTTSFPIHYLPWFSNEFCIVTGTKSSPKGTMNEYNMWDFGVLLMVMMRILAMWSGIWVLGFRELVAMILRVLLEQLYWNVWQLCSWPFYNLSHPINVSNMCPAKTFSLYTWVVVFMSSCVNSCKERDHKKAVVWQAECAPTFCCLRWLFISFPIFCIFVYIFSSVNCLLSVIPDFIMF